MSEITGDKSNDQTSVTELNDQSPHSAEDLMLCEEISSSKPSTFHWEDAKLPYIDCGILTQKSASSQDIKTSANVKSATVAEGAVVGTVTMANLSQPLENTEIHSTHKPLQHLTKELSTHDVSVKHGCMSITNHGDRKKEVVNKEREQNVSIKPPLTEEPSAQHVCGKTKASTGMNNTDRFDEDNEMTCTANTDESDSQLSSRHDEKPPQCFKVKTNVEQFVVITPHMKDLDENTKHLQISPVDTDTKPLEVTLTFEKTSATGNDEETSSKEDDFKKKVQPLLTTKVSATKLQPVEEVYTHGDGIDKAKGHSSGVHEIKASFNFAEKVASREECESQSYDQENVSVNEETSQQHQDNKTGTDDSPGTIQHTFEPEVSRSNASAGDGKKEVLSKEKTQSAPVPTTKPPLTRELSAEDVCEETKPVVSSTGINNTDRFEEAVESDSDQLCDQLNEKQSCLKVEMMAEQCVVSTFHLKGLDENTKPLQISPPITVMKPQEVTSKFEKTSEAGNDKETLVKKGYLMKKAQPLAATKMSTINLAPVEELSIPEYHSSCDFGAVDRQGTSQDTLEISKSNAKTGDNKIDVVHKEKEQNASTKPPLTKEPSAQDVCGKTKSVVVSTGMNNTDRFDEDNEMTCTANTDESDSQLSSRHDEKPPQCFKVKTNVEQFVVITPHMKDLDENTKHLQISPVDTDTKPLEVTLKFEKTSATGNDEETSSKEDDFKKKVQPSPTTKVSATKLQPVEEVYTHGDGIDMAKGHSSGVHEINNYDEKVASRDESKSQSYDQESVSVDKETSQRHQDISLYSPGTIQHASEPEISKSNTSAGDGKMDVNSEEKPQSVPVPTTKSPLTRELSAEDVCEETKPVVSSTGMNNSGRFEEAVESDSRICDQLNEKQSCLKVEVMAEQCVVSTPHLKVLTKVFQINLAVTDHDIKPQKVTSKFNEAGNDEETSPEEDDFKKKVQPLLTSKVSAIKLQPVEEVCTHDDGIDMAKSHSSGVHKIKASFNYEENVASRKECESQSYDQENLSVDKETSQQHQDNKTGTDDSPGTIKHTSEPEFPRPNSSTGDGKLDIDSEEEPQSAPVPTTKPPLTKDPSAKDVCEETKSVVSSTGMNNTDRFEEDNVMTANAVESDSQLNSRHNEKLPSIKVKMKAEQCVVNTPHLKNLVEKTKPFQISLAVTDVKPQKVTSIFEKASEAGNDEETSSEEADLMKKVQTSPTTKVSATKLPPVEELTAGDKLKIAHATKIKSQQTEDLPANGASVQGRIRGSSVNGVKKSTSNKDKKASTVAKKSEHETRYRSSSESVKSNISDVLTDSGRTSYTKEIKLKMYTKSMKIDECTYGRTPLHLASMKGLLEAVQVLVGEFEFDPNIRDTDYQATPLHLASQNGHLSIVEYLSNVKGCDREGKDMNGLTPLHYASRKGRLNVVKFLSDEQGCNPEAKNHQQQTALHYACHFGHKNIVKFLIKSKDCNSEILDNKMRTPLHLACEYRHTEIVHYLVHEEMCNTNAQDIKKRTPLHYACIWWWHVKYDDDKNLSYKVVETLLSDPKCDINERTKDGDTALHLACKTDRLDIVDHLLSKPGCNPNARNVAGQTPLQLTSHLSLIAKLTSKGANPMLNVMNKWQRNHDVRTPCLMSWSPEQVRELTRSGMKPMELFIWLIEQVTEEKAIEAIQSIIEHTSWNFNTLFGNGYNALHIACKANRAKNMIVECLLLKGKCNPNIKTSTGQTPLQLSSNLTVSKKLLQYQAYPTDFLRTLTLKKEENYLLDIMKYLADDAKWQVDIALLLACEANRPKVVQFFLAEKKCNPNAINSSKRSPLQLTSNPDIIKLLLQYGANPVDVYKFHGNILGTKQPLRPSVKVFIVGNPSVGKSSLTAALQDEPFIEMLSRPKKVSGVDEKTAGVIPYEFHSKKYGRITMYDFAGQREFYGSHAALLCNAIQSSPPIFLLVVNLNEDDEAIKKNIVYWLSFIENQCTSVDSKPHIIIVGSHADILLARKEDPEEKEHTINMALKEAQFSNMEFVAFITMNCSYTNTTNMRKLRRFMKENVSSVRSQTISFSVHCFQVYLHDKFRDQVAVHLKTIQKQVQSDCVTKHDIGDFTFRSFVPTRVKELCEFCKELSDQGHILFLNNPSQIEDSWIIIDKSSLFSEVTGTIFAPASFKEHIDLASSTGVVPFSKIQHHFPTHNPDVIVGYLSHLEFCQEISDNYILHLLDKDKICSENERHFFFSGLVTMKIPDNVWKPKPQQFSYHCGWILQCTKPGGFLIDRFIKVLMLRLAFSLALAKSPNEIDDNFPAIQRECSIWTNGIFWGSKCGPQILVEICNNEAVIVLMRCEDIHLIECVRYRPQIMKAVLQCAREFCPKVDTREFFLDPSQITEYPLVEKSFTKLTRYPIEMVASTCTDPTGQKTCIVLPTTSISLQHLLQLEPYAVLKRHLIEMVLQEHGSKSVSDLVLNEITECGCETDLFIKMFASQSRLENSVNNLYIALKKWRDECGGTFHHLRERLGQYSIFAGREADIFDMASIRPPEEEYAPPSAITALSDLKDSDKVDDNHESAASPTEANTYYSVNPGVTFLDLDVINNGTSYAKDFTSSFEKDGRPSLRNLQQLRGEGDTKLRIIDTVASQWEQLAIALGFDGSVIAYVKKDYVQDSKGATYKILQMWLGNEYDNLKDPISWSTLLECLGEIGQSSMCDKVLEIMETPAILESVDL